MLLVLTGLKYSFDFTVVFSKFLYFYRHKKSHILPRVSEKMYIIEKFQKSEFEKYATSGTSAFTIISISLIQYMMDKNCHNSY